MQWLTFRQPDEARFTRGTPPSVTEILPELLIGEYPRPQYAAWVGPAHGVIAALNLQVEFIAQRAAHDKGRRECQ